MHYDGTWNDLELQRESKDGKMVPSAAIWYDILTCRENFESNEAEWCILTLFETYAPRIR